MVHLGEVGPEIWEEVMEEMEKMLADTNFKRQDVTPDWRKLAHRRKFEREAFSTYGYFKDVVLHPQVQQIKHFVEENARLSDIVVGEPFTSFTNVFIICFLLFQRLDSSIILFLAAFLLSLNPVYVSLAAILTFAMKKGRKPKGYISRKRLAAIDTKAEPLAKLDIEKLISSKRFDHILLGNDIATYYTAALLSRCGHKCIVIEPRDCSPNEIHPDTAPCSAPLVQCKVSNVERYQPLLDCVQSVVPAKRVVFAPVGSADDGFTNAIIRIIAPGQSFRSSTGQTIHRKAYTSTLYCRPGEHAIVHFLCSTLSIEKSKLLGAFQKIRSFWPCLTGFLYSRCVQNSEWLKCSLSSHPLTKQFREIIQTSLDQYLFNCDIGEGRVHDALHALSCTIGAGETLPRNELSSFSFGMASQVAENGVFISVGGASALLNALKSEICSVGGMFVCDVDLVKLEVMSSNSTYKVTGVAIGCDDKGEVSITCNNSVISGLGVLSTYVGLLSEDILTDTTRKELVKLKEMKPKVKIIFWLEGSREELGLVSTEFFQVVITQPVSGTDGLGASQGSDYCHIWSPSAMDPNWKYPNSQVIIVEMDVSSNYVSLESVDWVESCPGPSFYVDIRNKDTNPNAPMFAEKLCRTLTLSKSKEGEFVRIAEMAIRQLYPLVSGKTIICSHVEPPVLGGGKLANNTAKYETNLSAKTEIENFYITGTDLAGTGLSGDLQSGWITANAVLGYSVAELSEGRSMVQDMI